MEPFKAAYTLIEEVQKNRPDPVEAALTIGVLISRGGFAGAKLFWVNDDEHIESLIADNLENELENTLFSRIPHQISPISGMAVGKAIVHVDYYVPFNLPGVGKCHVTSIGCLSSTDSREDRQVYVVWPFHDEDGPYEPHDWTDGSPDPHINKEA